jgi:protein-tyrosine-phosphatase
MNNRPTAPKPLVWRTMRVSLLCLPPLNEWYLRRSAERLGRARRIIAVCRGNTCRSPFLEGCLNQCAARLGITLPPVISRGLSAQTGERSSQTAIESARRYSVDLTSHTAKSIRDEVPLIGDLCFVMNPTHAYELATWYGATASSLIYIGVLSADNPAPFVKDPYGGDEGVYNETYTHLLSATNRLLEAFRRTR